MENTIRDLKIRSLYLLTQSLKSLWPLKAGYFGSALWFSPIQKPPSSAHLELAALSESLTLENIKVRSWGPTSAKKTVVLVHGWGGRWDQFGTMIPLLKQNGYRVISFDLPAHGETPGYSTSIPEWMPFFIKLSEHLDTKPLYITHSFGFMAISYALKYHKLPASAIIAINSPTSFQFLLEQYSQKLKLNHKTVKSLLQHIKLRVGADVEERVTVQLRNLKKDLPVYMIADEHDKEVPYAQHNESRAILNKNFFTTQNKGHSRILQSTEVHQQILKILESH